MMQPHHRSYYVYFEEKHRRAARTLANRRMSAYVAMMKLRDKKCSVTEYHFFFKKLKKILDIADDASSRSGKYEVIHENIN